MTKRFRTCTYVLIFTVFMLSITGCGQATRSPIVEVSGTIAYEDGDVLPEGTKVVLSPVLGGAGSAMAETDAAGNFSLKHVSGSSGAEVGNYTVELRSPPGMEQEFYSSVPSAYTDGGALATTIPDDGGSIKLVLRKSRTRRR